MGHALRVLMVGGTAAEAIADELRSGGYEPVCETVTDGARLRMAIGGKWDIAIADFHSGCGALETLRIVQEAGVDLPVIVVSGKIKDADVLAVLKAGAADHMTRGNLMRLKLPWSGNCGRPKCAATATRSRNNFARRKKWKL